MLCGEHEEAMVSAEVYYAELNTWRLLPHMLLPRSRPAACCRDDVLYVMGGAGPFGQHPVTDKVECFDLRACGSWRALPPMLSARCNHTCCVGQDGRIYVFGGTSAVVGALRTAEVFDPDTQKWSVLPDMPLARSAFSACRLVGFNSSVLQHQYDKSSV